MAALYPNCKTSPTTANVEKAVKRCGLVYKEIDKEFLAGYVSVLTGGKIRSKRTQKFLSIPKSRTSIKSFSTHPKPSQFTEGPEFGPDKMTDDDVRALLAIAAAKAVRCVMTNHYFTIGGDIYRQADGGAIGLDLTVQLASI